MNEKQDQIIYNTLGAIGIFIVLCIVTGFDFDGATMKTKLVILASLTLYAGK